MNKVDDVDLMKKLICTLGLSCLAQMSFASCGVSIDALSFAQYDVFERDDKNNVATVQVACVENTSYQLKLSTGNGSYTQRYLSNGQDQLSYNLYTNASLVEVWGDGTGFTKTLNGAGQGLNTHYIYGKIPARQNVSAGQYQDVIQLILEY